MFTKKEIKAAEILLNNIKEHGNQFLNTSDFLDSANVVYRNLSIDHCLAALWMTQKMGMILDLYNLHDIIINYENLKAFAKYKNKANMTIVDCADLPENAFQPRNLLEYFLVKKIA